MNYKRLKKGAFVDVDLADLINGDRIKKEIIKGVWVELNHSPAQQPKPVRVITPDAMRDRFSFGERVAIKSSSDMQVQTFYDDLSLRKKMVNLDSERFDLAFALLKSKGLLIAENDETIDERILRLKADGTQDGVI